MATGIPKRLNLDTFEINIFWPKNMIECDPRVKIDFLRSDCEDAVCCVV